LASRIVDLKSLKLDSAQHLYQRRQCYVQIHAQSVSWFNANGQVATDIRQYYVLYFTGQNGPHEKSSTYQIRRPGLSVLLVSTTRLNAEMQN